MSYEYATDYVNQRIEIGDWIVYSVCQSSSSAMRVGQVIDIPEMRKNGKEAKVQVVDPATGRYQWVLGPGLLRVKKILKGRWDKVEVVTIEANTIVKIPSEVAERYRDEVDSRRN